MLSHYDAILGTPWFFQHSVCVGLNPARVVIGSDVALPLEGASVTSLASRAMSMVGNLVDQAPFRAINHRVPLIDVDKVYPWRPSRLAQGDGKLPDREIQSRCF
ncbi:hypothetical protein GALMADRAFT_255322 [Galerina marginata CBS 339.88]|uniref:Uncharacterized protein n=1 Tax=Galerina marginata (strain CBS 339.88) TaxID=685588 RepID=A0A067STB8_GALM3|nr:hypothetical protein GALMADRAFT_255322 [Galerina marginata CBS 339.88]